MEEAIVWDTSAGELIQTIEPAFSLWSLALSPDGTLLATAHGEGGGALYEVDSGRPVHQFAGDQNITAMAFSPTDRLLALAHGTTLELFDVGCMRPATAQQVGAGLEALGFSPDGSRLAIGAGVGNGSVSIFEIINLPADCNDTSAEPALREEVVFHDPAAGVRSLAFAPDGEVLIAGTWDGRLLALEFGTGQRIAFVGPPRPSNVVAALGFAAPDLLVAAGSGGVTSYDWRLETLRDEACRIAGRVLTDDEQRQYLADLDLAPCAD